jgi:hypothetical protein
MGDSIFLGRSYSCGTHMALHAHSHGLAHTHMALHTHSHGLAHALTWSSTHSHILEQQHDLVYYI